MPAQFFENGKFIYLADLEAELPDADLDKLAWLLNAKPIKNNELQGSFVGPRKEMVTPWSTNAVEIARGSGVEGVTRIEKFQPEAGKDNFDPMLEEKYSGLNKSSLVIHQKPEPIVKVDDIEAYNNKMGLALSQDEIEYLKKSARDNNRSFTDSEIFGFAQVNSEHCRHKIFNGKFIVDGVEQESSLFQWIKKTTRENPGAVVTNYNDNVSFVDGEDAHEFAPTRPDVPSKFKLKPISTVFSLKAETHNFPTTVEPINGAATGSGGEIRDRMAGGKGSLPLAGTACYMTSYPRLSNASWEAKQKARPWLYQSPRQILTKASDGASDFGNKFGQPLINGSVLTFEQEYEGIFYGYDKTIMLAGGIGTANKRDALKDSPEKGDKIILMGGDNYRIGMGGGAVSSVNTGEVPQNLELNAVQRANPEMQKRVLNALRGLLESTDNPIILIHDHGAGGHINCLSELIEDSGGIIHTKELPVGDPSLSDKELIGNESQERMGLVIKAQDVELLKNISERERAPMYVIGTVTGDKRFIFENKKGDRPVDVSLDFFFGKTPRTVIVADTLSFTYQKITSDPENFLPAFYLGGLFIA